MNESYRPYLIQARSDWRVYGLLTTEPVCHQLHYLQMCTEKLAKAYFRKRGVDHGFGHAVFVRFLRTIPGERGMARSFKFQGREPFRAWIDKSLTLAREIELLAPALAGDGPNPEYPWPRDDPREAPAEFDFRLGDDLKQPNGRALLYLIETTLTHFESWFQI